MTAALRLPAELTIYTAAETRSTWLGWLAERDAASAAADDAPVCAVDASACDEIDAAGAQLLVALARSLARRHQVLHLADASSPVQAACRELGLDTMLAAAGAELPA